MSCGFIHEDSKILTADLRYIKAKDIKIGERVIGFKENIEGQGQRRRFTESIILGSEPVEGKCLSVTISDGSEIKCSEHHRLLVPKKNGSNWHWEESGEIKKETWLTRMLPYFEPKNSYEAGYLAGFYDGEGSVCGQKNKKKKFGTIKVSCSQKGGKTMSYVLDILEEFGYKISSPHENGTPEQYEMVYHWELCGKAQCIKFLGEIRPKRLIKNLNLDNIGALHVFKDERTFVSHVKELGVQPMRAITTSTKTFIADGFAAYHSGEPTHTGKYDSVTRLDSPSQVL